MEQCSILRLLFHIRTRLPIYAGLVPGTDSRRKLERLLFLWFLKRNYFSCSRQMNSVSYYASLFHIKKNPSNRIETSIWTLLLLLVLCFSSKVQLGLQRIWRGHCPQWRMGTWAWGQRDEPMACHQQPLNVMSMGSTNTSSLGQGNSDGQPTSKTFGRWTCRSCFEMWKHLFWFHKKTCHGSGLWTCRKEWTGSFI